MARYFLKPSGSNNIEGIIEWDGISTYTPPPGYVVELATTTASINYAPSSSNYVDKIFGGKLFGQFSGELTGSITINGQTIDDILNQTKYGTLTLHSSSLKNVDVKSGSFKVFENHLYLPLFSTIDIKNPIIVNHSSSFAKIIDKDINNYYLTLKSKQFNNISSKLLITNTQLTSSVSSSISNNFYLLNINNSNSNNLEIFDSIDNFGTDWYIDIDLSENITKDIIDKSTKYGKLRYNSHSNNVDPGSGYFSINSSTVWSEATELYLSIDNHEKNTEISSSKSSLYSSTLNDLFYQKILGSRIKLESDVSGDNTYKIFEVEDVLLVTGSADNYVRLKVTEKDSYSSGYVLLAIGQKFNIDFEILNKNKRQINFITESKSFKPPYWAKEVIVMSIGSGGGGGGGVDAKSNHQYAVGGAGGGGGSISYSHFKEVSGSIRIDCFVGNPGRGGNTGSSARSDSYGTLCVTCSFESNLPFYEELNIVDTVPTILSQSSVNLFEILDETVVTGSCGMSGDSTFAYVYNTDFITNESSLLGIVSAPGGVGGSGGYSLGLTGSLSSSLVYDLIVSNSLYPFSIPGGTNLNSKESIGEETYYGGPGGYGIALNISETSEISNFAPSLPWESNSIINIDLPFGRNMNTSKRTDSNYDVNSVSIGRFWLSHKNSTKIPIISTNLNKDYLSFSYDKPSSYAPTGGGGGTGWLDGSIVSTSSLSLGIGGKLNSKNSIFEYPISVGGNGGNNSTLGGLQILSPQSGSGPGAGGGGGASDYTNGNPQNGADGGSGVVVVISIG